MLKEMLRKPLEQAMALLWLVTIVHLLNRSITENWTFSWVLSCSLSGLLAVLLAARFHLLRLVSVPIVLELSACLVLLSLLGVQIEGLALATVWFAVALWLFCRYAVDSPSWKRVHDVFRLNFDDDSDIGADGLVMMTEFTLLVIAGVSLVVQLSNSALFNAEIPHSWLVLLTIASVLMLLCLSQERYAGILNSYLMLALACAGIMELLSLTMHSFAFVSLASDSYAGLLFVALAALMMGIACRLRNLSESNQALYADPLWGMVTALTVLAVLLQLHFFLEVGSAQVGLLDVLVMFSAGLLLLVRNQALQRHWLDAAAILMLVTATLWLQSFLLHHGDSYSIWPVPTTYLDQWLSMALLSVMLSSLSTFFGHSVNNFSTLVPTLCVGMHSEPLCGSGRESALVQVTNPKVYCGPLNTVANLTYIWSLLGTLRLFFHDPANDSVLLPCTLFVLLLGQLPVLRTWPYSQQLRGVGILLLLMILQWSLLAVLQLLETFRLHWAVMAYFLWAMASYGLPKWNARYPDWAISSGVWPWAGMMLSVSALLAGGPVWIVEWPWLVMLAVYLFVMNRPYLDLPALLLSVLSLLWLQSVLLHPNSFSLWPRYDTAADIWLSLSIAALLFSQLSNRQSPSFLQRFSQPFQQAGVLCFIWALIGGGVLFVSNSEQALLPWIGLILLLALFSLSGLWPHGERLRGIGSALLLSVIVVSCLQQLQVSLLWGLIIHCYLLWWVSYRWIPLFNDKYPAMALEARSWAWLGLLLMFAGVGGLVLDGIATLEMLFGWVLICGFALVTRVWYFCGPLLLLPGFFIIEFLANPEAIGYLLALSAYCILMLRYTDKSLLSWMAAFFFTLAGTAISALFWPEKHSDIWGFSLGYIVFTLLAWLNLQVALLYAEKRYRKCFNYRTKNLSRALLFFSDLPLFGVLLVYVFYVFIIVPEHLPLFIEKFSPYSIAIGLLLIVTFLNLLSYAWRPLRLHGLVLAGFCLAWVIYFAYPIALLHPPLYLSLCCLMLAAAYHWSRSTHLRHHAMIQKVLNGWLRFLLIVATIAMLFNADYSLQVFLINLVVVAVITGFYGLWRLSWNWFAIACLELLVLLHGWPFLWLSLSALGSLYPWYALQAAFLAWLFLMLIQRRPPPRQIRDANEGRMAMTHLALHYWPWLIAVSLVELLLHMIQLRFWLVGVGDALWLMPPLDSIAALGAGLLIAGMGVRHVKTLPDSGWIYGIVALIFTLGIYVRLLGVGLTSLGFMDTALLILFAYGLMLLHRSFHSRPLMHLALMMPVAALLTVPIQLESPEASLTLMVTGVFYLLLRRDDPRRQLPVYLALLAFNIGIYLWVPGVVEHSHLLQVYVIPAALSMLVLLQLHRRDLRQNVLMAGRLGALSVIYAVATLDVFLLPDLKIFMLAMGLSLLGLILGIAMRVRAYLYAGVSFMLLNVAGQFVNYYPEEMLGKAIVLMLLGAVIIAAMIWFNIKRAEILSQFKNIQDELETWE